MNAAFKPPVGSGNPQHQPTSLSCEERSRLSVEIRRLSKEWVGQVSQMQQLDGSFADRLARCTNPVEAAEVCGAWMGHRIDSVMVMQHRLVEAWIEAALRSGRQSATSDRPTRTAS